MCYIYMSNIYKMGKKCFRLNLLKLAIGFINYEFVEWKFKSTDGFIFSTIVFELN
jgi:hypothetical protein